MNDQDPIVKAREAVEGILNALHVARVVFVDDTNSENVSLEDVLVAATSLDEAQLYAAFPELGEEIPDDPDVLGIRVRNIWGRLDRSIQVERSRAVLVAGRRDDGDGVDDIADVSILNELIPEEKLVFLSPSQWETQKEQLLRESLDQRTLFLFDRDFSKAGGDTEGGIKIIASLLSRDDSENLICGLLTHTVTPETQPEQWVELSKANKIPQDRFVVIPKLHLSQAPILFALTLKFAALSPDFAKLKCKTREIIAEAASAAAAQVEKVNIYDLEHIVFRVSADEGLWEPDMLFRLHSMFHRLEARRLAHEGGDLEAVAAKLRAVSGIPTDCDLFAPPSSGWRLQREELYESEDYINRNHLPLEVGDIFERVGANSTKKYILLAQPCDLMVRSNGKRQPEPHRVPLAEVICTEKVPQSSEEMPYFGATPTERWYVRFKLVHFVRVCILDLCVLNQDGTAKIIVEGKVPSGIRPAWRKRHQILSRLFGREIRKADLLTPVDNESREVALFKQNIRRNLGSLFFDDDLFKGSLTEVEGSHTLAFDCKRIGRISRARAIGLLMSYTASLSRPAYDRDFGNATSVVVR